MRLVNLLQSIDNDQEVFIDFQDGAILCGKCKNICGKIRNIERFAVAEIKADSMFETECIQILTDEISDLELACCKGEEE